MSDAHRSYIPEPTGCVIFYHADGRVTRRLPDGTVEELPREEMVSLLGFDPAATVTQPFRCNQYAQVVGKPDNVSDEIQPSNPQQ